MAGNKVIETLERAKDRGATEVLILGVDGNGMLHIDTTFGTIFASHYVLNRAIFEINLLQSQMLEEKNGAAVD